MQNNNRDSSIWRSLAVAFGDGLAFGVGMKLTQSPSRTADDAAPPIEPSPLAGRLEEMEQRLARMERAPMALASGSPGAFDQKVREAVVNALDARLAEHAGQVERRLTELEAKIAIDLQSLRQQDHAVVTGIQGHIEDLQSQFNDQMNGMRKRAEEDRAAVQGQVASLHREFAENADKAVEERVADEVAGQVAPLRLEVNELRRQLVESDTNVLDVIQSIGRTCMEAAERIASRTTSAPPPDVPDAGAPPSDPVAVEAGVEAQAEAQPDNPVPGFAQPDQPHRLWRVPLVSSLLLTSAGVVMMHYL